MATILVVDTRPSDRRMYVNLLGGYGHRILEAGDGAQALELAKKELPDLIITDILMPHMDGFSLVHGLRSMPLLIGTPVIFHTNNYDESEIHKLARKSGVWHIIRKPAEPHVILRVVNESLKRPAASAKKHQTGQLQREHLQVLADNLYKKVSELEEANEQLRAVSLTDGLTGLNNRRGFMIMATGLLKFARRMGYSISLMYIDLDSLKYINDTYGHMGGDTALRQFSRILTNAFRDSDVIGRMGGDEFVVMLIDASENDLADMKSRLQDFVDVYNLQAEHGQTLTFSLGVIRVDSTSTTTMEALLSQADEAMYAHKRERKRKA